MAQKLYPFAFLITRPKASSNCKQYSSISINLVDILFEMIFSRVDKIQKFFSRFWFLLRLQLSLGSSTFFEEDENQKFDLSSPQCCFNRNKDERKLCRQDMETAMARLGLFCSSESEELKEGMGPDELSQLFDEKEPSLEEVKEAFNVFDQNRDGFIDEKELQMVLCKLGLKEGCELENCRKMIRKFDENGDGRIDFDEFLRFMESSCC